MLSKNKYVSSLDLKMLGAKFITIPDSHLQTSSLSSIRKTKNFQFPSILTTMPDEEHLQSQIDLLEAEQKIVRNTFKKPYKACHLPIKYKTSESYLQKQREEIAKYRNMISKLKKDNETIHTQIKNLYRSQKLNLDQPRTKAIKNIIQAGRNAVMRQNRFRMSPEAKKYQHVYQDLGSQQNPYRKQSLQIQKKFTNNNLHKNFESFLVSQNKRVPQFIKNIR